MSVFTDQEKFMTACDQSVDKFNDPQYKLYIDLIKEEVQELNDAIKDGDLTEQLDALIDILVVTTGAIHSAGFDANGAWDEVMKTNFAKIDPTTGKVNKRADGKVLKPEGWVAPNLIPFLRKRGE
jgi:predicted HAD superfamily Cof-like phosphohydrolase